jgi:hypothetical protein
MTLTTPSPATVCYNATTNLTATASGGTTTAMTYTWKIGTTSSTTTTVNSKTSQTLTTNTNYTVSVTNSNGCTVTAPDALITVNAELKKPTVAPVVSGICINSGELKFLVSGGSPGTFDWTGSSPGTASATVTTTGTATYTISGTTAGTQTVKVLTKLTENGITCTSASATASAEVYSLPVITSQPTAYLAVDLNGTFSLTVTANPVSGSTLGYQWKRNGSNVTNGGLQTYTAFSTWDAAGNYTVEVSNAYTCSVTSSNAQVTVYDFPPPPGCDTLIVGKIGSGDPGSCDDFTIGVIGIEVGCVGFKVGYIGK